MDYDKPVLEVNSSPRDTWWDVFPAVMRIWNITFHFVVLLRIEEQFVDSATVPMTLKTSLCDIALIL